MSKSQIIGVIIYFITTAFSLARADQPKLVIVDNDFTGPPDTLDDLRSALMFLDNPNVKVLGFTVVTGNGWRNEEVAHLLRLEEIASRCDVPVIPGAVTPFLNTLQTTREWERHYSHRYMGAWDTKEQRPWEANYSPHEKDFVPQIPEELPKLQPARESAVEFLIKQVHAYPHQISVFAGGPAILVDRSLITESRDGYFDVVVDPQKADYGAVKVSCQNALIDGQSKVQIVTAFDYGRFKSLFVDSMIGPKPKISSN